MDLRKLNDEDLKRLVLRAGSIFTPAFRALLLEEFERRGGQVLSSKQENKQLFDELMEIELGLGCGG